MLLHWAKMNLETLKLKTAREYLIEEIIPKCKDICNSELRNISIPELNLQHFMLLVGLKKVNVTTVRRWLRLLGFTDAAATKCYLIHKLVREEGECEIM
jgi:hypothetical protein